MFCEGGVSQCQSLWLKCRNLIWRWTFSPVTLGWQEKQCKLLWCVQPAALLSIGVRLHKTSLNMLNRNSHYTGLHQVYLETLPNPDSSTSSPGRCLWGELLTHFLQYFCKLTLSGDRREEGGGRCLCWDDLLLSSNKKWRRRRPESPPQSCRRWVLRSVYLASLLSQ